MVLAVISRKNRTALHHLHLEQESALLFFFIIVILAVLFFISGLLHLLVRFLTKSSSSSQSNRNLEASGSDALQRQLQQLFHLHDSGLDQAFIDALPVFSYKEVVGPKEPFDCAVCLCEFSETDQEEDGCPNYGENGGFAVAQKRVEIEQVATQKGVFPVRLGKFRKLNQAEAEAEAEAGEVGGETSSSKLDARRCYSMGSYQYVVGDAKLRVALSQDRAGRNTKGTDQSCNASADENTEGKKISIGTKTDSYSVSKIWLWSKKGKFASSSDAQMENPSSPNLDFPWLHRTTQGI
ncbi:UNVERIFIED_CONTAM: RING-H2 finger protein ATL46 [Sesamum angustifolium]|uniref:RING-H2 finger protein ATL46 n=1 Tax=Sesamum angustifolium TaxID=2727405 RepID=A0AAW2NKK3_9LAMI